MSYINLFLMYQEFMESNSLRHEDLIAPIRAYALASGQRAMDVLHILQSMYQRI